MKRKGGTTAPLTQLWLSTLVLVTRASLTEAQSAPSTCPLNFTVLADYPSLIGQLSSNGTSRCSAVSSGQKIVSSLYLNDTGFFLVPQGTSSACVAAYEAELQSLGARGGFSISGSCPNATLFPERGTDVCHNIQSAGDFAAWMPIDQLAALNESCSGSLSGTGCGACNIQRPNAKLAINQVTGSNASSSALCNQFVDIYVVGVVNEVGLADPQTAGCVFVIGDGGRGRPNRKLRFIAVGLGATFLVCLIAALGFFWKYRRVIAARRAARNKRTKDLLSSSSVPSSSINWFNIEELEAATRNFHRDNILGTGGYGNVYRGTLPDGSVVAVKRFKNCAPAGDADFVHEVEMISSVKHSNLVGIRGCCVASSVLMGGHQRIIVYDFMPNGSLQDYLDVRKTGKRPLDLATRRKVAVGMARGLAYLHHEALPAIFHRDIKPSNILLDSDFTARLADFGLAKFTPEGVSHVTTRWVGTPGYAAPEYAVYGQLTAKSDVYSFGMVLLELITGKKALSSSSDDPPRTLLSDWAWPIVKQGGWKRVVDPRLAGRGDGDEGNSLLDEEIEKFILVGLLCAHPQVFCRPSIDQALKMLESGGDGAPALSIFPDRPLPLTSDSAELRSSLARDSSDLEQHIDLSGDSGFTSYKSSYPSFSSSSHQSSLQSLPSGSASSFMARSLS